MLPNVRGVVGLSLAALIGLAAAQTSTTCDPTKKECPEEPALGMSYDFNFSEQSNASTWDLSAGRATFEPDGVNLAMHGQKESPTLKSQFTIMFGRFEVHMKAARGQGIVSSIVLLSKDLDEIDWEFIGGNETHVQTNYFGKGNQTSYDRAFWHPVAKPMDTFHNYTVHWTAEKLDFFIDTAIVRTLKYEDALGGKNYPQTPMTLQLGIWAGGDPDNEKGVIEWAGGETDFTQQPFNMYVKSAKVDDFGTGKAYKYSDLSGSWQSIESIPGNSTQRLTLLDIHPPPKPTITEKFNALPSTSKVAIYASCGAVGAILAAICAISCFRKRRQGRREAAAFQAKQEAMDREDAYYRTELNKAGISPDSLGHTGMTAQEFASGGVALSPLRSPSSAEKAMDRSPSVPPLPTVPASYQGSSLRSPTGSLRPNGPSYGDAGLSSPGFANGGQFNSPRSPGPGGYSVSSRNGSGGGYVPAAAPNNATEFYAPQPRTNTNGSWNGAGMDRAASSNSQRPRQNGGGGFGGNAF